MCQILEAPRREAPRRAECEETRFHQERSGRTGADRAWAMRLARIAAVKVRAWVPVQALARHRRQAGREIAEEILDSAARGRAARLRATGRCRLSSSERAVEEE